MLAKKNYISRNPKLIDQADVDPTSDLGTSFDGLDARKNRDTQASEKKLDQPQINKYLQAPMHACDISDYRFL